jgi:anti-anti-sigma factor
MPWTLAALEFEVMSRQESDVHTSPARQFPTMAASDEFRTVAERTDDRLTIRWSGDCDAAAREILDNDPDLTELKRGQLIEVHLSDVTFMDSAGIHTLLALRLRAGQAGAQLVVRDASAPVRRVLELTGLTGILESDGTNVTDYH